MLLNCRANLRAEKCGFISAVFLPRSQYNAVGKGDARRFAFNIVHDKISVLRKIGFFLQIRAPFDGYILLFNDACDAHMHRNYGGMPSASLRFYSYQTNIGRINIVGG